MRPFIASLSRKLLSTALVALLVVGLLPATALAVEDDAGDGWPAGEGSVVDDVSLDVEDASGSDPAANARDTAPESVSEGDAQGEDGSSTGVPAGGITNEELPLDGVVAQTESTKSFFLAQALESTRTVPMVSAKLPIDGGSDGEGAEAGEDAEGAEPEESVSVGSTVVGAFEQNGMTFAIEADGESVALMAVDYSKLPEEHVSKQVIAIPEVVSPDGIDAYSVTRVANGAFAGLTEEGASPEYVGCKALFEDEALLAEAGIDPEEVARYLNDEDASAAAQDGDDASASSDAQAKAGAFACEKEPGSKPSAEEGGSADPDRSDDVRTIVSMDGDVATLDDGSTYEFKNSLAGKTGILVLGIPASVSKIEDDAFAGFETLQYLVVSDDNPEYASYDGALYSADLATLRLIPEGRVGAVRVAPDATDMDPEVFSHCPLVDTVVAGPDSAAFCTLGKNGNRQSEERSDPTLHCDISTTAPNVLASYRLEASSSKKAGHEMLAALSTAFFTISTRSSDVMRSSESAIHDDSMQRSLLGASVLFGYESAISIANSSTVYFNYGVNGTGNSRTACKASNCSVRKSVYETETKLYGGSSGSFCGPWYMWWCVDGYFVIQRGGTSGICQHFMGLSGQYVVEAVINGVSYEYGEPLPTGKSLSSLKLYYSATKPKGSCTVTWNPNGGSSISSWTVPKGQSLAGNTAGATSLPAPTRTGWVFDGWYKSNSSFTSANKLFSTLSSTTPTADATYYARWKISWTWRAYGTTTGATQIVKYSPGNYSTSTAYSAVSATAPSSCSNKPVGWELSTWSRSSTSNSGAISPGSTVAPYSTAGSFTYYARWKAQIKRNLNTGNGASVDVSNLTTIYASGSAPTATYKPSDVSRTGYTFDGWNVDYESASIADDNSKYKNVTVTFKGAATIVAQWTPEKRNVTWNATGGTDRTTSADYDTQHTAPTQGTGSTQTSLSGWTLEGWYTDAACTTGRIAPGGKTAAVTANTTYYAKWTRTITFKAQGGSGGDKTATATRTGSDKTGTFTTPAAPTRSNWTFKGWTASATGTSYTAANKSTTSATATWYARWEMSVTLNANGGALASGVTSPIKVLNSGTSPFDNHVQLSAGIPVRTGYAFDGWRAGSASGARVDANGTVPAGTIGGDQTLYAAWRINTYHLSWDVPHGSHANRTSDFTVEDCPIAMGAAIPDAGYAFQGWSGTGIAAGSNSFTVTSSMLEGKGDGETLAYAASITANPYTVRLHANDGTDAVASHDVAYDAAVSSVSIPKRYGYAFAGYWTKDADGTKEELYFDEDGSYVRDSGVWKGLSDVDLYACWTLMANLEVPINAPGTVGLAVDRATVVGEDAAGVLTGESVSGALRSAVPQEVPVASIELEALQGADGSTVVSRILGAGNPERCGVEVSLGSSNKALLRLAGETSSMLWVPAAGSAPRIPAAVSAPENASGEGIVTDDLGNAGHMGELPLSYAMRLFPGFDVYRMPEEDTTSEPAARIVFTVDLTGLSREEF